MTKKNQPSKDEEIASTPSLKVAKPARSLWPASFFRLSDWVTPAADAVLHQVQEKSHAVVEKTQDLASKTTQGVSKAADVVLQQVQEKRQTVVKHTQDLAHKTTEEMTKAADDVDALGVAGGVVAMSAGEAVGMAIGGALGAVAGPGGAIVGAQIGGFAGSSLGARYGYDLITTPQNPNASSNIAEPGDVLTKRGVERLGGAVGEAGGIALGAVLGGPRTQGVFAHLGEGIGGSIGEQSVGKPRAGDDAPHPDKSYRKAPTKAWFKRIAKENVAETVISGALGAAGGIVGGVVGQKIAERVGIVAARRLDFADHAAPEFVDMNAPAPETDVPPDAPSTDETPKP